MLAPSPDWFTGTSQFDLCSQGAFPSSARNIATLAPYDAGTDSGALFNASNSPTNPPQPVSMISCGSNFCMGSGAVPSLGSFTLTPKFPACSGWTYYYFKVTTTWGAMSNNFGIPSNPHFSPFVIVSHAANFSLFKVGSLATTGVKNVAETGNATALQMELTAKQQMGYVFDFLVGRWVAVGQGMVYLKIRVDAQRPYVSMISMIAPSPDWFTGVSGVNMCNNGMWKASAGGFSATLNAYDAGTDSGTTFTASNSATMPPQPVSMINCGSGVFCTGMAAVSVAGMQYNQLTTAKANMNSMYYVEFTGNWGPANPRNLPLNPHFSPFVIAAHAVTDNIFELGGMASAGVKQVAETGMTVDLTTALTAAGISFAKTANPVWTGTGKTGAFITVNGMTPLVSVVGMIAPSPDWFTGVNSMSMFEVSSSSFPATLAVNPTRAYDAGTDNGTMFTSANSANMPPQRISMINCGSNFCAGNAAVSIGSISFSKACTGSRTYTIDFSPTWSAVNQPLSYPPNAHWSPIVVVSHGPGFSLFTKGQITTAGVKLIAETGLNGTLVQELKALKMSGEVLEYSTSAGPIWPGTGRLSVRVRVDGTHPFVSVISMIAPSPDWFSGISAENMCAAGAWKPSTTNVQLRPYDAGTDNGTLFNSSNSASMPQQPISEIMCNGAVFCSGGGQVPNLGTVSLTTACLGPKWYSIEFCGGWNYHAQPLSPDNSHFSPMVAAGHFDTYSMFKTGGMATPGVKLVAETGNPTTLQSELGTQMTGGKVCSMTTANGPTMTGTGRWPVGTFKVENECRFLSAITMLAPSPDWFTGASGIDMCDTATGMWKASMTYSMMMAYDAGTDSGTTFKAANQPTTPPVSITRINCDGTNFCTGSGPVPSLGSIVISTTVPTKMPSSAPSKSPSATPSRLPSRTPTSGAPTVSKAPSVTPSTAPSASPIVGSTMVGSTRSPNATTPMTTPTITNQGAPVQVSKLAYFVVFLAQCVWCL